MHKYSFRVVWSDEDNAYVATCPELPGVSALGASEDEALREAKVAMELYIEDVLESGEALPAPQTVREYSGQTRLRLPKSLHRLAAEMAEDEGVSLNQFIIDAVAARVGATSFGERLVDEMKKIVAEQAARQNATITSMVLATDRTTTVRRTLRTETSTTEETSTARPYFNLRKDN